MIGGPRGAGVKHRLMLWWEQVRAWWNDDYDVICTTYYGPALEDLRKLAKIVEEAAQEMQRMSTAEGMRFYHDEIVKALRILRQRI